MPPKPSYTDLEKRVHALEQVASEYEMLKKDALRYRLLFEQSPIGVFHFDNDGTIIDCNDNFVNIIGSSRKALVGLKMLTLPDKKLVKELHQALNGHTGFYEGVYQSITADKSTPVKVYVSPLLDKGGKSLGCVGIVEDITEQKQAEADRESLQTQLIQARKLESIGRLAGGIAHDFNNILFPIVGLSELILEDLTPGSPMHEKIQEIMRAGRRGRDLVGQILAFGRQSGQDLMPVSLQQILKEVLTLCRSTIPANIAITRHIQADCGLVMADPTQMHQIAMNLITNAYHAMAADKGAMDVQLRQMPLEKSDTMDVNMEPGPYAVMSVSDTGCGISADMMEKIFDPYFTTKKKGKGTGLGLSVVQGIVRAHKGYITVQSQVNKGSRFIVYLPVVESSDRTDPAEEKTEISGGKEHILLVDDEKLIVQLESQILERLGYTITSFTDSLEAVDGFQADPEGFDLVITDMAMPHMTGAKLAGEMIAIRSDIPIIMCTGFSDRISEETAKYAGIKHLLMKPVVMSDLACVVRKVLDEAKK